jgi:DnaJ-class molecular chaperone
MRDPYTILGLPRTADKAEIKKAFRKLAKKYHPDQSKEPRAKERFAEANSAYEILGDDQKRAAFDRGEIDADGKPRYQGFEGFGGGPGGGTHYEFHDFGGASPFGRTARSSGGGAAGIDPSDFFADLLNNAARGSRQQAARGEDVTASVSIPIEDVLTGASARVSLPTGRTLEVKVPAGMEDGKAIRLRGQGHAGQGGGPSGDAIVTVTYAPHKLFHVEKRDLKLDLPVTVYEAVLGGKVTVPTLDGSVEITLPPGANRGRTLRLRGKGLPGAQGSGDLLVTPRIALPDKVDPEFEEAMQRWKAEKPYDPRAGKM